VHEMRNHVRPPPTMTWPCDRNAFTFLARLLCRDFKHSNRQAQRGAKPRTGESWVVRNSNMRDECRRDANVVVTRCHPPASQPIRPCAVASCYKTRWAVFPSADASCPYTAATTPCIPRRNRALTGPNGGGSTRPGEYPRVGSCITAIGTTNAKRTRHLGRKVTRAHMTRATAGVLPTRPVTPGAELSSSKRAPSRITLPDKTDEKL